MISQKKINLKNPQREIVSLREDFPLKIKIKINPKGNSLKNNK